MICFFIVQGLDFCPGSKGSVLLRVRFFFRVQSPFFGFFALGKMGPVFPKGPGSGFSLGSGLGPRSAFSSMPKSKH